MSGVDLKAEYAKLKEQADVMAGELHDIQRRVAVLTSIYLDSNRNHAFPQMAAHGALWAINYFEAGGSLGRLTAWRYFYNRNERAFRLQILREFAESFRAVNRLVCIDTYANYHFVKKFGDQPGTEEIIAPSLLDALTRVHHARRNDWTLNPEERFAVFQQSFHHEQEVTVAPGVAKAVAEFECPIMRALCMHPLVRFTFFPRFRYLFFRDFSNTDERINKGMTAYEIADRAGWDHVFDAMRHYGQMPRSFFESPEQHFQQLREATIRKGLVAQGLAEEPN